MDPVDRYLERARERTIEEFVLEYRGFYLLKRPAKRPSLSEKPEHRPSYEYNTVQLRLNVDPFADRWGVLAVRKREGNPYPERISIGRAGNCDLVLRVPVVSKVHAHLLVEPDGSLCLRDNQAQNGTFRNGRRLEPLVSVPLLVGDQLRFGPVPFELTDAPRLHEILRSEME